MLFGVLKSLDAPLVVFVVVAVMFVAVAVGQTLLLGGRDPRKASILVGAVLLPVICIGIFFSKGHALTLGWMRGLILWAFFGTIGGAIFGYLAGTLVAGVFLVLKRMEDWKNPPSGSHENRASDR